METRRDTDGSDEDLVHVHNVYHYGGHHYDRIRIERDRTILGNVSNNPPGLNYDGPTGATDISHQPPSIWPFLAAAAAGVGGSSILFAIARTSVGNTNTVNPSPGTSSRLPSLVQKSPRDLYREGAYSLCDARDKIEGWDTNGCRSSRPELRREGFVEAILSTYVRHFRSHGLIQLPHILVVNDNININDRVFTDAVNSSGDIVEGPSRTKFAHHKMAAWQGSANHFGFDVYVFRAGSLRHMGLHPGGGDNGGKGYGNWRWYAHTDRLLFDRTDLGRQHHSSRFQCELVTFREPF